MDMSTGLWFQEGKIEVQLVDHMGTDLSVVNAARVSFDKESKWEYTGGIADPIEKLSDADTKLISYLATHGHWSPFAHAQLQFRIKAPIFVARQLVKHQVGLVWNEVSRRYVSDEPTYYYPEKFRAAVKNVKQGSSETESIENIHGRNTLYYYEDVIRKVHQAYLDMISEGVAPELARAVLPTSAMTEWWWSGTLYAFARVCRERLDPHAQLETQMVAWLIALNTMNHFPVSWSELVSKHVKK